MSVDFHVARLNVARALAPLDAPVMRGFVERLDDINALAEAAPGFIWRLKTDDGGNATALKPYADERVIVNFTVWRTLEDLRQFVYVTARAAAMRQRKSWFETFGEPNTRCGGRARARFRASKRP